MSDIKTFEDLKQILKSNIPAIIIDDSDKSREVTVRRPDVVKKINDHDQDEHRKGCTG